MLHKYNLFSIQAFALRSQVARTLDKAVALWFSSTPCKKSCNKSYCSSYLALVGVEPTTTGLGNRRSILLSYKAFLFCYFGNISVVIFSNNRLSTVFIISLRLAGVKPATFAFGGRRSILLSYKRLFIRYTYLNTNKKDGLLKKARPSNQNLFIKIFACIHCLTFSFSCLKERHNC